MYALTFYMPNTDVVRTLLYALLAVAAVVVMFPVLVAIMPSVVGCCAVVLPFVGKVLVGAAVIAAYAFVTKPW